MKSIQVEWFYLFSKFFPKCSELYLCQILVTLNFQIEDNHVFGNNKKKKKKINSCLSKTRKLSISSNGNGFDVLVINSSKWNEGMSLKFSLESHLGNKRRFMLSCIWSWTHFAFQKSFNDKGKWAYGVTNQLKLSRGLICQSLKFIMFLKPQKITGHENFADLSLNLCICTCLEAEFLSRLVSKYSMSKSMLYV